MVQERLKKLLLTNWHFIGVILFFGLHGYAECGPIISFDNLLWLLTGLIAGGLLLYWLSTKLFRSQRKAGIFTSLFFIMLLFFGAFQDVLAGTSLLPDSPNEKYWRLFVLLHWSLF
ncbi:hypothetical protein [Paraflavitalea speifideaquila]|uniref:hypothetical protein n=1 Tax=Paraflavitalea speifideaquila TaxID=3076558 RepID=UPI0028E4BF51|nr:hypothetical protein [Paraflavitalea speifideiaquila]